MLSRNVCSKCGHSYTYHFHSEHLWILKEEKVLQIDENLKNQYDKYELEFDNNNIFKNDIKFNISKLENLNNIKKIEINDLINDYKNIALNDNYKRYLIAIKEFIEHYHIQAQTYGEKQSYLDILNIINKKIELVH